MNKLTWIAAAAVLFIAASVAAEPRRGISVTPPPPPAGATLKTIYRVPGVYDNGGDDSLGSATVFHCTNLDSASATLEIKILQYTGHAVGDQSATVASFETITFSTHNVAAFSVDRYLNTGAVGQGEATILSTTEHMFCSSMLEDASAAAPSGIALHEVRYNPLPGTEE